MSDLLARLIAAGTPLDLVGEVARLIARAELLEERRANDRERKARQREASREVTGQPGQDGTSASRAGARAEPKITNSSGPSEKQGKEDSSLRSQRASAPKPHLMPDDFEPKPETFAKAEGLGFSRQAVLDKRDALHDWSHGKGVKRPGWDATLLSALRRDAQEAKGQGRAPRSTGPPRKPSIFELNERANAYLRDLPDEPEHPLALPPYRQ
jgi:hypothetical protein